MEAIPHATDTDARVARIARGFTLVELLVVVGIIGVLVAILLPVLNKARQAAQAARCASDVRQMLIGYTEYHIEHRGALLLGYPPATVNGQPITVDVPGVGTIGGQTARRYPWRLVKYVSGMWPVLHGYEQLPDDSYALSLEPAIGINAIFLGGHYGYYGFTGSDNRPNLGKHVTFRASEVRRPSGLIVFAECQIANDPQPYNAVTGMARGLNYLSPPYAEGQRWRAENGRFVVASGLLTGLPKGRFGAQTVTGFFDGHVESASAERLQDMRLWCVKADRPDWDHLQP